MTFVAAQSIIVIYKILTSPYQVSLHNCSMLPRILSVEGVVFCLEYIWLTCVRGNCRSTVYDCRRVQLHTARCRFTSGVVHIDQFELHKHSEGIETFLSEPCRVTKEQKKTVNNTLPPHGSHLSKRLVVLFFVLAVNSGIKQLNVHLFIFCIVRTLIIDAK